MKRKTAVLCAAFAVCALPASALGVDWFDNFDSYPVGPLDGHGEWEAWGGGGQSGAMVSSQMSLSAPNSCAIDGGDDAVHQYAGHGSGVWDYSAWQFIPVDASGEATFFILLNSYDGGGGDTNWSTQLKFDPEQDFVESEFEGSVLPLVMGEWAEIRVLIDLDTDQQTIFYNGEVLSVKSWTEGVSGGGALNIAAVDLWGNETGYPTYYDDMSLTGAGTVGACCFEDGTCIDGLPEEECTSSGGEYQGNGTECAFVDCPVFGGCGLLLTAPATWVGDTSLEQDTCDLRPSKDAQFEITLPYDAEWTFSVCDAGWDTYLYLGSECCSGDLAENDDDPDCGQSSKIIMELETGTYFLTVEGRTLDDTGEFPLVISSPCVVECPNDAIPEGEWDQCDDDYVDHFNSGCSDEAGYDPFSPIECGDVICGWYSTFAGSSGVVRDTDWYELDLAARSHVAWEVIGERSTFIVIIDSGDGSCEEGTYEIVGSSVIFECGKASVSRTLEPGLWWFYVSTADWEWTPCPSIYVATLNCVPACKGDIAGPDGVSDEVVDVLDLILMLGQWGSDGYADITGPEGEPDGVVDVLDLILLLSNWGPC